MAGFIPAIQARDAVGAAQRKRGKVTVFQEPGHRMLLDPEQGLSEKMGLAQGI
jgi:hypothetical protein